MKNLFAPPKLLCVAIICTIALFSCNKDFEKKVEPKQKLTKTQKTAARTNGTAESIQKINEWLDGKRQESELKNSVIGSILANLDIERLSIENLNEAEDLVIIPLTSSFHPTANPDALNFVVFKFNAEMNIADGNLVQIIFNNAEGIEELPDNSFAKILNNESNINGVFIFRNLADKFLYQNEYENGNLIRTKVKNTKEEGYARNGSGCLAWYLVTTYTTTNSNGTLDVETDWEYLYTSCDNTDEFDETGGGGQMYNCSQEAQSNFLEEISKTKTESSTISVEVTDINNFRKHKDPSWTILRGGSGWILNSKETGIIELIDVQNDTWKWVSLTHGSITKEGMCIGAEVTFTQGTAQITISPQIALMSLEFNVTYQLLNPCTKIPILSWFSTIDKKYTATGNWLSTPY